MARGGTRTTTRELPPPLPPERRTVGQLVAESIRLYGRRPPFTFLIGLLVAIVNVLTFALSREAALVGLPVVGGLLFTPAFVLAISLVTGASIWTRDAARAYLVGFLVFLPFPFLATAFVLPGLAWLALLGLAVPVALVERLPVGRSFARGIALARADFVHMLGGLAALALVVFVTQGVVYLALRAYAENTARVAAALAALVASPTLFFGSALLYLDQEARLRSRLERRKERDAHVPDALHPHREGDPDAAGEPGSPA
jgi:hypothetical protein